MKPTVRTVRLVLADADERVVGALPPYPVETPWWQDIGPVVRGARERFGIEAVVLRLLATERPQPPGGEVTYLAEVGVPKVTGLPLLEPWNGTLDDHPLRQVYARPGGPAADLAWVESILESRGMRRTGPPEQIRTWNLSSVWRIPVVDQHVWLKALPPFMAREGPLISLLASSRLPAVLGHDHGRTLLAEVPGEDLYHAHVSRMIDMITVLVELQVRSAGSLEQLLAAGLPDWRSGPLADAIARVVERTRPVLSLDDARTLSIFVDGLPRRFAELTQCGLPDTLVHGDFHPGNFRGDAATLILLDWGDSGVGHPLLDQSAFLEWVPPESLAAVREHWAASWRNSVPGADPLRTAELLAPVAAARRAAIYQRFLDNIEPSEHPYHRTDPRDWLEHTARLLRS